jgi:hypothetical protein
VKEDTLKQLYSSKTDEELLSLASEKDTLVETARLTLMSELHLRGLSDLLETEHPVDPTEVYSQPEERGYPAAGRSTFVWLGLFLLNTIVIYTCAVRVSPVLVGRWFAWVAPVVGFPSGVPATDWYLEHLEIVTIIPALIAGYFDLSRFLPTTIGRSIGEWRSDSAATWAWTVPSAALLYKMLLFHAPSSVLFGSSMTAWRYFFEIQRVMPTFRNPLAGDPVRMLAQMYVTAPLYAGVAYSSGALAERYRWLGAIFTHRPRIE